MTPALPDDAVQRIREALQRSDKIEAIKVYCESHPVGLAEAKQAVEEMEAALFATNPNWYTQRTRFLRRPPSRRMQIFALIGYSLAAVSSWMQIRWAPHRPVSEQSLWYNSPYYLWTVCFFFTGFALLSALTLWHTRRKP